MRLPKLVRRSIQGVISNKPPLVESCPPHTHSPDCSNTCSGSLEQLQMKQVLEAYAHYKPSFGYCRGLSFVAATLIRHTADVSFGRRYEPELLRQMELPELRELAIKEGQGGGQL